MLILLSSIILLSFALFSVETTGMITLGLLLAVASPLCLPVAARERYAGFWQAFDDGLGSALEGFVSWLWSTIWWPVVARGVVLGVFGLFAIVLGSVALVGGSTVVLGAVSGAVTALEGM